LKLQYNRIDSNQASDPQDIITSVLQAMILHVINPSLADLVVDRSIVEKGNNKEVEGADWETLTKLLIAKHKTDSATAIEQPTEGNSREQKNADEKNPDDQTDNKEEKKQEGDDQQNDQTDPNTGQPKTDAKSADTKSSLAQQPKVIQLHEKDINNLIAELQSIEEVLTNQLPTASNTLETCDAELKAAGLTMLALQNSNMSADEIKSASAVIGSQKLSLKLMRDPAWPSYTNLRQFLRSVVLAADLEDDQTRAANREMDKFVSLYSNFRAMEDAMNKAFKQSVEKQPSTLNKNNTDTKTAVVTVHKSSFASIFYNLHQQVRVKLVQMMSSESPHQDAMNFEAVLNNELDVCCFPCFFGFFLFLDILRLSISGFCSVLPW
jgi:hypothetical protein